MARVCTNDISSAAPIQSAVTPKVLRYFLQIIYTGEEPVWTWNPDVKPVPLVQCLRLAQRWDCDCVEKIAKARLDARIKSKPWAVFIAVSTIDDVEIARQCLSALSRSTVDETLFRWTDRLSMSTFKVSDNPRAPNDIQGISPAYLAELYRIIASLRRAPRLNESQRATARNPTAGSFNFAVPDVFTAVDPDWTEVARQFFRQ